jgi:hypothetical protein
LSGLPDGLQRCKDKRNRQANQPYEYCSQRREFLAHKQPLWLDEIKAFRMDITWPNFQVIQVFLNRIHHRYWTANEDFKNVFCGCFCEVLA